MLTTCITSIFLQSFGIFDHFYYSQKQKQKINQHSSLFSLHTGDCTVCQY